MHWPRICGLCSVSWCLAEGQWNRDQRRPMGRKAREGLYSLFTLDKFWEHQAVLYNYRTNITGIGNCSIVFDYIFLSIVIYTYYVQLCVEIEAL